MIINYLGCCNFVIKVCDRLSQKSARLFKDRLSQLEKLCDKFVTWFCDFL